MEYVYDITAWIGEHKLWVAVSVPVVIAFFVVRGLR